jgi:hypothetical protein
MHLVAEQSIDSSNSFVGSSHPLLAKLKASHVPASDSSACFSSSLQPETIIIVHMSAITENLEKRFIEILYYDGQI